jgi:hypothetical protein
MRILWASDNYELYERTLASLHQLAPENYGWKEYGCIDLGEPYCSCPIRFAYPDEFRDSAALRGFINAGSCDLVLVNESDLSHVKAKVPVVPLSEVKVRLTDPRALFEFLFSYKATSGESRTLAKPRMTPYCSFCRTDAVSVVSRLLHSIRPDTHGRFSRRYIVQASKLPE